MHYVFVLKGRRGGALRSFRRRFSVEIHADSTRMVVDVRDDAEVYSILERLDRLGVSIISFAQLPWSTGEQDVRHTHPTTSPMVGDDTSPAWKRRLL